MGFTKKEQRELERLIKELERMKEEVDIAYDRLRDLEHAHEEEDQELKELDFSEQ